MQIILMFGCHIMTLGPPVAPCLQYNISLVIILIAMFALYGCNCGIELNYIIKVRKCRYQSQI